MLLIAASTTRPAFAFGPAAETAVATSLARTLSPATGWTTANDAALAAEIARRFDAEAADPEAFVDAHRYEATAAGAALLNDAPRGGAVDEFAAATAAVRAAYASPDPAALVAPLARLTAAACDLADPFMTTAPDADEVDGARAAFTEEFDAAAFEPRDLAPAETPDVAAAAASLAATSAATRADVERAAATGDDAALSALRAERLRAALALAAGAARQAWSLAGVNAPAGARSTALAIWPNPARGAVRVSFALPAAGPAHLELIDLSGRCSLSRDLGIRAAGAQSLVLDAAAIETLSPGTYFVRIQSRTTRVTGRLVRVAR